MLTRRETFKLAAFGLLSAFVPVKLIPSWVELIVVRAGETFVLEPGRKYAEIIVDGGRLLSTNAKPFPVIKTLTVRSGFVGMESASVDTIDLNPPRRPIIYSSFPDSATSS